MAHSSSSDGGEAKRQLGLPVPGLKRAIKIAGLPSYSMHDGTGVPGEETEEDDDSIVDEPSIQMLSKNIPQVTTAHLECGRAESAE